MPVGTEGHHETGKSLSHDGHGACRTESLGHILRGRRRCQNGRHRRDHVEHKAGRGQGAVLPAGVGTGADVDGAAAERGQVGRAQDDRRGVAGPGNGLGHRVAVNREGHGNGGADLGGGGHRARARCGLCGILIGGCHCQHRRQHGAAENKAGAGRVADVAGRVGGGGCNMNRALTQGIEIGTAEQDGLRGAGAGGGQGLGKLVVVGDEDDLDR